MKKLLSLASLALFLTAFSVSAHKSVATQSERQVLASILPNGEKASPETIEWHGASEELVAKIPRLKKLSLANASEKGGESAVHLARFTVQGDWGPIEALAAIQDGKLLGLGILSFTKHKGDIVTKEVFLRQFRGLKLATIRAAKLKKIPAEPLAVEALRAGLIGVNSALENAGSEGEDHHGGKEGHHGGDASMPKHHDDGHSEKGGGHR